MQELPADLINIIIRYDPFKGYFLRLVTKGLMSMIKHLPPHKEFLNIAICENLSAVKWVMAYEYSLKQKHLILALSRGTIETIEYILHTIECGQLKEWLPLVQDMAIESGRLKVVKLFIGPKEGTHKNIETAASQGNIKLLKYLAPRGNIASTSLPTDNAAGRGSLECLVHLIKKGYPVHPRIMRHTVRGGSIACFEYLIKKFPRLEVQSNIIELAGKGGHLPMIKYLHERGCKLTNDLAIALADKNSLEGLKYLHEQKLKFSKDVIKHAVDSVDCIKFLQQVGVKITDKCMKRAVKRMQLNSVMYLREQGCVLIESYMETVIIAANLELVSYLYENGCPIPDGACNLALSNGYVPILSFLHERGSPLPRDVFAQYYNKHWDIEMIKYLYSQGYKNMDPSELSAKHLNELVEWLHSNGHVFDESWLATFMTNGLHDKLDYILSLGYIMPSKETIYDTLEFWDDETIKVLWKYNCYKDIEMTVMALSCKLWALFRALVKDMFWDESTVITVLEVDSEKALIVLTDHGLIMDEKLARLAVNHSGPNCASHILFNCPQYKTRLRPLLSRENVRLGMALRSGKVTTKRETIKRSIKTVKRKTAKESSSESEEESIKIPSRAELRHRLEAHATSRRKTKKESESTESSSESREEPPPKRPCKKVTRIIASSSSKKELAMIKAKYKPSTESD